MIQSWIRYVALKDVRRKVADTRNGGRAIVKSRLHSQPPTVDVFSIPLPLPP
jgi:hypothetical protein